jgi:hypothetical protein
MVTDASVPSWSTEVPVIHVPLFHQETEPSDRATAHIDAVGHDTA